MAGLPRGQKDPSAMLEDYDVYVRGNLESAGLGLRGGVVFFSEAVRSFRMSRRQGAGSRGQRPLKCSLGADSEPCGFGGLKHDTLG